MKLKNRIIPLFIVVIVAIPLLAVAACDDAGLDDAGPTETRDNTYTVDGNATLIVSSENGKIEVSTGADDEVRVQATLRGINAIDYEVGQDGNTITVQAEVNKGFLPDNVGVDITVTTPVNTDVELETSNGMISLDGIEGMGTLRTSNGKIVLENIKGDFEGRTSNGGIDVEAMEGTAVLKTSNGGLDLQEVTGEVDAETSNGGISYSGDMIAGGDNRLITSNGNVDVELLGTPSIELDASTSYGEVTCQLPITATTTGDEHLIGTIGDGEADLYIRTSNGDINIK